MLKFFLKAGILTVATQFIMNQFVARDIVSRSDGIAAMGFFIGLAWMFLVGFIICKWWMQLKESETTKTIQKDNPFAEFDGMENPEASKKKGEIK